MACLRPPRRRGHMRSCAALALAAVPQCMVLGRWSSERALAAFAGRLHLATAPQAASGRQGPLRRRQLSQAGPASSASCAAATARLFLTLRRAAGSETAAQLLIADVTCEEEGTVQIRLPPASSGGLERNFDRPRAESLEKTAARMAKTLAKNKKKKKKRPPWPQGRRTSSDEDVSELPAVEFLDASGVHLGDGLILSQVLALGQAAMLVAGVCRYHLRVNRPKVLSADCRGRPVVGLPLLPSAKGRFCGQEDMRWEWRRVADSQVVGRERAYTPQPCDVGSCLQLTVRPPVVDDGLPVTGADEDAASATFATAAAVRPAPTDVARSGHRAGVLEAARARSLAPGQEALRVVSYNTLADCYRHCWGDTFPYCDPETYHPEVRLPLCRHELAAYRGDILCLQEVDASWFREYWEPQLALDGYSARYTKKVGGSEEGCAIFVRDEALELLELRELPLSSRPRKAHQGACGASPVEAAVGELLEAKLELADLWRRLGTVAQLALLRSRRSGRTLLVCNTHLYFSGMARHVRMLQAALILEEAHRLASELAARGGPAPALLFCGDLNSHPDTGAVELLLKGRVKSSHQDWLMGAYFKWGFASSRQAARLMTEALKAPDPASAWRALAARGREELGLQGTLERCRRMSQSWEVLVQGHASAEAEDDGQVGEEEEQLLEEEETASSSAEGAAVPDGPLESGAGGAGAEERRALQAALRAGGSFKNSRAVAAAQLALDAGLSEQPLLALGEHEREAVRERMATLEVEAEAKLRQAALEQEELSSRATAAGEADAGEVRAGNLAAEAPGATVCGLGLELQHHFHLASAYEETPEFTNFVGGYEATLDWILFDSRLLRRVASAPLPSRELVAECTALPSWRFPSDHLLLAADLAWPAGGGGGGEEAGGWAPAELPAPERPAPSHFALPLVLDRARQQRYAYVLMAYDVPGRPLSYIWRAVTMSRALQRLSDYPVLLLTNTTHFPDGSPVVESFAKLGVQVLPVHQVPVPPHIEKSLTPQWRIAYWKLQIWRFTHYDKLVWLDIDGVITRSLDHVFELEPPWAQRDVWVCSATQGFQDWPCSGLMLIEPSEDTYQGLLEFARSTTVKWWVDGDQRLLQHYFQDVARTPMKLLDLADAAFGKCLGVIPNLFNETPGEIWNMPAYVHKSSVKNECFYFIIAKQLRQVEGRTVNICHYHHLGSYWRELFCQGLAEIKVKTPVTEAYCDDFLWHRHR